MLFFSPFNEAVNNHFSGGGDGSHKADGGFVVEGRGEASLP